MRRLSGDVGAGVRQVVAHRRLRNTEGPADAHGGPLPAAPAPPPCGSRYTVIFDTRMMSATSATVRKVTTGRGAGRWLIGRAAVGGALAGRTAIGRCAVGPAAGCGRTPVGTGRAVDRA